MSSGETISIGDSIPVSIEREIALNNQITHRAILLNTFSTIVMEEEGYTEYKRYLII